LLTFDPQNPQKVFQLKSFCHFIAYGKWGGLIMQGYLKVEHCKAN